MMTLKDTDTNRIKASQAEIALSTLLAETLRRGFFGTAAVEIAVQDGTIQHIRRRIEQIER
jgi:hypothetical protein